MAMRLLVLGLFVFLLGVQLRAVDTYVLNEKASEFVAQKLRSKDRSSDTLYPSLAAQGGYEDYLLPDLADFSSGSQERIQPPKWLAWSLMSVGAVLVLGYPCFRK